MDLKPLGRTGIDVSPIGLGLFKLGRNVGFKYPQAYDLPTDKEAASLLAKAAELGVNLLDTAPAYGTSEARLGELMRRHAWFGGRDRWVICTKAGEEFDDGQSRYDFSPQHLRASVERSLRRIGVDELDIVLLHSDGRDTEILRAGAMTELEELKRRGLIRALGFSSKTAEGGIAALDGGAEVLMVAYNVADVSQSALIELAGKERTGVLIKKPFASGNLAGDPMPRRQALEFISARLVIDVSSVVVGTANPDHLLQNVNVLTKTFSAT